MVVHLSPVASAGAGGTNRHLYLGTDGIQEASAHITGDKQDTETPFFIIITLENNSFWYLEGTVNPKKEINISLFSLSRCHNEQQRNYFKYSELKQ